MAKKSFLVPYVARELRFLWREKWVKGEQSKEIDEADLRGDLGRTYPVDADTPEEAARIVEHRFPGTVAIRESIKNLGRR